MDILLSSLPTLLGAVVGAAASIIATMLTNRRQAKIEETRRIEARRTRSEQFQLESAVNLQVAGLGLLRATAVVYKEFRREFSQGRNQSNAVIGNEAEEARRQCVAHFVLFENRMLEDDIRDLASDLRKTCVSVVCGTNDSTTLDRYISANLNPKYKLFEERIGTAIRSYAVASQESE